MRDHIASQPESDVAPGAQLGDDDLVALARTGDATAFELLMRRHNQRVYRVVRSVLRDDADVEDVMQQAYLAAFAHLDQFAGTAQWSTWVCRIAINEALGRNRQRARLAYTDESLEEAVTDLWRQPIVDPERSASGRELRQLVEEEMDRLPEGLRVVMMMREIEGMTTAETAAVLQVEEDVVKTRLHRARTWLRGRIEKRVGEQLGEAFAFGNERCARVVAGVMAHWNGRAWTIGPRTVKVPG
jgi:RNA polymerase sigma-70 factor (ECF subfamily)